MDFKRTIFIIHDTLISQMYLRVYITFKIHLHVKTASQCILHQNGNILLTLRNHVTLVIFTGQVNNLNQKVII